jgi:hypothetical protein
MLHASAMFFKKKQEENFEGASAAFSLKKACFSLNVQRDHI